MFSLDENYPGKIRKSTLEISEEETNSRHSYSFL